MQFCKKSPQYCSLSSITNLCEHNKGNNQREVKADTMTEYSTSLVTLQTQTYIMYNTSNMAQTIKNVWQ
jgi:hypothetical protein